MASSLRAVLAGRFGPRSRAVQPGICLVSLFLAAIAPAAVSAHDIYHGLTSNFGKDCCDNSDCRPAYYRITPAGVQMLIDQVWIRVPRAAIRYRLLSGDSGATSGGHWCGRRANDIDALDDTSGEGYFTFCAFLPPGLAMNSSYDRRWLTVRRVSARGPSPTVGG
jgi:hypothetical protein